MHRRTRFGGCSAALAGGYLSQLWSSTAPIALLVLIVPLALAACATAAPTRRVWTPPTPTANDEPTPAPPATQIPSEGDDQADGVLPPRERDAAIRELLDTNGGCDLPCLWGIEPGTTNVDTAWEPLMALGATMFHDENSDPSEGHRTGFVEIGDYSVGVATADDGNIVQAIDFYAQNHENPYSLQTDWQSMAMGSVLSRFGAPSRAFLEAVIQPTDDPLQRRYALWLYYDDLGFALRYGGSGAIVGRDLRICPGWAGPGGMDSLRMLLQASSAATPLEALTRYTPEQMRYVWPIEQAYGMDVAEFHELYTQGDGLECIDLPLGGSQ